jgi:hypothetical protein
MKLSTVCKRPAVFTYPSRLRKSFPADDFVVCRGRPLGVFAESAMLLTMRKRMEHCNFMGSLEKYEE